MLLTVLPRLGGPVGFRLDFLAERLSEPPPPPRPSWDAPDLSPVLLYRFALACSRSCIQHINIRKRRTKIDCL